MLWKKNQCMAQVVFNAGLVNGLSLGMEQKEILAKRRLIDNNSEEELFTWGKTVKVCKCCAWIQVIEDFVPDLILWLALFHTVSYTERIIFSWQTGWTENAKHWRWWVDIGTHDSGHTSHPRATSSRHIFHHSRHIWFRKVIRSLFYLCFPQISFESCFEVFFSENHFVPFTWMRRLSPFKIPYMLDFSQLKSQEYHLLTLPSKPWV